MKKMYINCFNFQNSYIINDKYRSIDNGRYHTQLQSQPKEQHKHNLHTNYSNVSQTNNRNNDNKNFYDYDNSIKTTKPLDQSHTNNNHNYTNNYANSNSNISHNENKYNDKYNDKNVVYYSSIKSTKPVVSIEEIEKLKE